MTDKDKINGSDIKMIVPLEDWILDTINKTAESAAEKAAIKTFAEHQAKCVLNQRKEEILKDHTVLANLERRFYVLVAIIATACAGAGSLITKLF